MNITLEKFIKTGEIEIKTGPFGTQFKASEYVESGTPVLNVKNLGYSTVISTKIDYIGENTLERLSMHILKEGDIVFGRKGAVDRHAYISANENGWMQGSDCIRLRVKTDKINPRYLSYYFLTAKHKAFMISMCSHGTTMASLNQSILSKIVIELPERYIQDYIVSVLSILDKKIKINEEVNKNLPHHPCNARIAEKQRRQILKSEECLHTNGKIPAKGNNEETAEQFSSLSLLAA